MKKLLMVSLVAFSSLTYAEGQDLNSVTEATKSVVSGIVKFGKDFIEGADEGVDQGRKEGMSKDGAVIVDNGDDLVKYLDVKLLGVKKESETASSVEVGFKNRTDKPVRLINMREFENVIVIDNDGYATNLASVNWNPIDVTVPSSAGRKQKFYFEMAPESVREIRIMGRVYSK